MNEEELIKETMMLDYSQLVMHNVYMIKENKRLENIIKEVREYIINHREAVDERAEHIIYFLKDDFDEEDILKILDDEKV